MSRGRRAVGVTIALAAALACRGQEKPAAFRPLDVGAPVPAYATVSLSGDTIRVGGPGEPTVLNVWATWCTSCREEMATLDSLQHEFAPRGVRVIGVSVDEGGDERVRRFAEGNHLSFTVAHDPVGNVQRTYNVVGVPTTFIIDRTGRLTWRHTGNVSDMPRELREAVQRAAAESAH